MQWEENQERPSAESPLEQRLKSLKLQGKKATASLIHQELSANGHSETLNIMLDDLLSPDKPINETDNIEWCKWIIASGKSPNDFSTQGELIDFSRDFRSLPTARLRDFHEVAKNSRGIKTVEHHEMFAICRTRSESKQSSNKQH